MPRGAKPGEYRGGRKKGVPNKVTQTIREAAQKHGKSAIRTLVDLMNDGQNDSVKIQAAKELLDRGYGKSAIVADINVTHEIVDVTDAELANIATAGGPGIIESEAIEAESSSVH